LSNSITPLTELFEKQPQLTVITATRRLSRRLLHDYNRQQAAAGLKAWPTPDILSWSAWIQRLWQENVLQRTASPAVLTTTQSLQLWQAIIEADSDHLLNAEATARQSHNARQLVIDYALDLGDKNNRAPFVYDADSAHWLSWHERYEGRLKQSNWLDTPAMAQTLVQQIVAGDHVLTKPLCLMGFDDFTPLQRQLLNVLQEKQLLVELHEHNRQQGQASLLCAKDPQDEIRQAAIWARQQFEGGHADDRPIGIIVPGLEQQRIPIERIFREVFYPEDGLADSDGKTLHTQGVRESAVFNISLGHSLKDEPLIITAFNILSLCHHSFAYDAFSQVLRSSLIRDAATSLHARSALDVELRRTTQAETTLQQVLASIPEGSTPDITQILIELSQLKVLWKGRAMAHVWVDRFRQCLGLFGWADGGENDNYRFQVMQSFDELLFDFSRLDMVNEGLGLSEAVATLATMVRDKVFQSGAAELPVQILGVLEAAGIRFSSLWVMGMTENNWPPAAQPNPFIPLRLQREHAMPHSSPQREYDYATHQTRRLLHAAESIVFSYPAHQDDETFMPGPLVALFPQMQAMADDGQAIQAVEMERLLDERGPPVDVQLYAAGSAALRDQAQCPFRAFVMHRLRCRLPEEPEPGNDPRVRGDLVHLVMEALWRQWQDSDRLHEMNDDELVASIQAAIEQVMQAQSYRLGSNRDIEQQRLFNIIIEWLAVERQRQPFSVLEVEKRIQYTLNELKLNLRIDRIDELADGSLCVIDYKTGVAKSSQWTGERPDEPQVPLYAMSEIDGQDQTVNAVAFAAIRAGECSYEGATRDRALMAKDERALAGIRQIPLTRGQSLLKEYEDWDAMLTQWQHTLNELAGAHVNGDAAVDPKDGLATCRYCDANPVCRFFDWDENGDRDADSEWDGEEGAAT